MRHQRFPTNLLPAASLQEMGAAGRRSVQPTPDSTCARAVFDTEGASRVKMARLIVGTTVALALSDGIAQAELEQDPIASTLEFSCDGEFEAGRYEVVLSGKGFNRQTKPASCDKFGFGTLLNKPLVEVLKKMRRGRDGMSRLPFKATIEGKSWRFVARHHYRRGHEISQSDFDDYVNTCLDDGLRLYARGGKLYCYVQPIAFYEIARP